MDIENTTGCLHLHSCIIRSRDMLGTLPSKWDSRAVQPDDRLVTISNRKTMGDDSNTFAFDPRLAVEGPLSDIFRIFTTGLVINTLYLIDKINLVNEPLTVCISGKSQISRILKGIQTGAGVAFSRKEKLNIGQKWMNVEQEQGGGLLLAIMLASLKSGICTPITFNIRSYKDLAALTEDLQEYEDKGFVGVRNAGLLRTMIGCLRMHMSPIYFHNLKDLPRSREEITAASLARTALNKDSMMVLPLIPVELHVTGAKLSKMTQAIAYKTIRTNMNNPTRVRTRKMLDEVKRVVGKVNNMTSND